MKIVNCQFFTVHCSIFTIHSFDAMKKYILLLFCLVTIAFPALSQQKIQPLELWYDRPAKVWEEALPLGNGTTGAMVFGGIKNEQYSLNDHTLWSGAPVQGNNIRQNLPPDIQLTPIK